MIALPTARGWLILAMTLGAAGVALVNVGLATALAASAFAAFLLAAFVMAQCSVYGIRVERGGNGDGVCGGELILPLTVTNRTILFRQATVLAERCEFAPGGVLHTAVPPLSPRESAGAFPDCGEAWLFRARNRSAFRRGSGRTLSADETVPAARRGGDLSPGGASGVDTAASGGSAHAWDRRSSPGAFGAGAGIFRAAALSPRR